MRLNKEKNLKHSETPAVAFLTQDQHTVRDGRDGQRGADTAGQRVKPGRKTHDTKTSSQGANAKIFFFTGRSFGAF